jgi:hypothetical protein
VTANNGDDNKHDRCDITAELNVQIAGKGHATSTVNCNSGDCGSNDRYEGTGTQDTTNNTRVSRHDPKVDLLRREVEPLFRKHKGFSIFQKRCACISDDFLTGTVKVEVLGKAKEWYREFVFTPEAIPKEMDLSGAELNLPGI